MRFHTPFVHVRTATVATPDTALVEGFTAVPADAIQCDGAEGLGIICLGRSAGHAVNTSTATLSVYGWRDIGGDSIEANTAGMPVGTMICSLVAEAIPVWDASAFGSQRDRSGTLWYPAGATSSVSGSGTEVTSGVTKVFNMSGGSTLLVARNFVNVFQINGYTRLAFRWTAGTNGATNPVTSVAAYVALASFQRVGGYTNS